MRILIAEDDFTSRGMLAAVLRKAGHEPVETVNGLEAWEALQQPDAPRLVILDWMMPEMDGLEVLRRVRAVETDRPPYILMLTSRTDKAEIIAGLDAGANDYLAKPFDVGELRARVEVGRRLVETQDELAKSREALVHQAAHDPLTGLLNRRAILDLLHKELARAGRHADGVSIGICDIDHFKSFNDTYGHQKGDDCLRAVAGILERDLRRPLDIAARYGGEEFILVLPGTPLPGALAVAESIRSSVEALAIPHVSSSVGPVVTISLGTATAIPAPDASPSELVSAADQALYRAKSEGRNRVST